MRPIRSRSELIELAAANAPTNAVARRMRENGARVFGGIKSPEGFPGWIVDAGLGRFIGIWIDADARKYRVTYPSGLSEGAMLVKGERL